MKQKEEYWDDRGEIVGKMGVGMITSHSLYIYMKFPRIKKTLKNDTVEGKGRKLKALTWFISVKAQVHHVQA